MNSDDLILLSTAMYPRFLDGGRSRDPIVLQNWFTHTVINLNHKYKVGPKIFLFGPFVIYCLLLKVWRAADIRTGSLLADGKSFPQLVPLSKHINI